MVNIALNFIFLSMVMMVSSLNFVQKAKVMKSKSMLVMKLDHSTERESKTHIQPTFSDPSRRIVWEASARSSTKVKEVKRTCEEYMALPASEYSVLTSDQIVRLNDHQFKCVVGNLNFFGNVICPVLYVDVNVFPEKARSEIVVVRAETTGSEIAEKINGSFSVSAVNVVSAGRDEQGRKTLNSDTKLKVEVFVPPSKLPLKLIQSGGNFIMQSTLSVFVAAFVRILSADFKRWSEGDNSRSAVEGAKISV